VKRFAAIGAIVIALALPIGLAFAHGQTLQPAPVAGNAGDTISLTGTDLGDGQVVPIHLIAADGTQYDLGTFNANDDGDLSAQFTVPSLPAGVYQIHAVGIEPVSANFGIGIDASQVPTMPAMPDNDGG
jgi:hypothetical protein